MSKRANPEGQKYPTNKKQYDENWLRIFGKVCPNCGGSKLILSKEKTAITCPRCLGIGRVEK